jgi:MbtH protein
MNDYEVVINEEAQYSIWPRGRDLPAGWELADFGGSKQDCLDHVAHVWTDMRPKSIRVKADESQC